MRIACIGIPSSTGSATISGMDGTVSSSTTVDVQHGRAIDVQFQITPSSPTAGDLVVIELMAEDVKGNRWVVNGTISMTMGDEDAPHNGGRFYPPAGS